jgi:hypothetical protein
MKKLTLPATAAIFFLGGAILHSQMAPAPKSPLQVLQAVKAANDDLLAQQKKTLETLDEMQKTSDQIKVMGKRG